MRGGLIADLTLLATIMIHTTYRALISAISLSDGMKD